MKFILVMGLGWESLFSGLGWSNSGCGDQGFALIPG